MRILVDKMPETPKECLFAKRNVERGYICTLQHCSCSIKYGLRECPCLKEDQEIDGWRAAGCDVSCYEAILDNYILEAPTIIPADKEGEHG